MPAFTQRLGDFLVDAKAISRTDLESALAQKTGLLGHFLCAVGRITQRQLARALAQQQQLAQVDLMDTLPAPELFCPRDFNHYIAHHYIPYQRDDSGLTLATSSPNEELLAFARAHYGCDITLAVTTQRELTHYFSTRGATTATRHARLSLRRRHQHLVADRIMLNHQLRGMLLIVSPLVAFALLAPQQAWIALLLFCNLFYTATLLIKLIFYRQGIAGHANQKAQVSTIEQRAAMLDDATLPIYSILVPMYQEKQEVMARLLSNLQALDYPPEKLDIKLICEADDHEMLEKLRALAPPPTMEIIAVPASLPRTKPKACNFVLPHARGEYLVIYDAEDSPAPNQLKLAIAMFRDSPPNVACLQAALNYYNKNENTLTRMFSIEYSTLFHLLIPALEKMRLPIPLGGTSNHLKMDALRAVGGWDAFNVTEDADLGIRLYYFGYRTQSLPSLTLEESPITLLAWLKQRTRWIKGYIQTWLVYMRDIPALKTHLGRSGYYGFQFFVGASVVTFLLAPIFWTTFILSLLGLLGAHLSSFMLILCSVSFLGGALSHWLFACKIMELEQEYENKRAAENNTTPQQEKITLAFILYPLYWLLHSLAAARALWQLATNPHYWDKTIHGTSRLIPLPKRIRLNRS